MAEISVDVTVEYTAVPFEDQELSMETKINDVSGWYTESGLLISLTDCSGRMYP